MDLQEWFLTNRRDLPWRRDPSPYRVWVSEVMLQQTQVSVVIPYFERWMAAFPTLKALAGAPLDKVLKLWEGLGYYSRAKNLHSGAQQILQAFGGEFPEDPTLIKGIGRYTAGAIRSFARHERSAAVDGNVKRVLCRLYGLEEPSENQLWELAEGLLPKERPWVVTEGLIELGALVCSRDPKCLVCPLRTQCVAFREGRQKELPKKKQRQSIALTRVVGVISYRGEYLVQKGGHLYEFPYVEVEQAPPAKKAQTLLENALNMPLSHQKELAPQKHTFTKYRIQLFPHRFEAQEKGEGEWVERLQELPFISGHRKILGYL